MAFTEILLAIGVVAGGFVLLVIALTLLTVTGPHCRCGHHRKAHSGEDTECEGWWRAGTNAVGVRQVELCACKSYRPTEHGYWKRLLDGTEERPR